MLGITQWWCIAVHLPRSVGGVISRSSSNLSPIQGGEFEPAIATAVYRNDEAFRSRSIPTRNRFHVPPAIAGITGRRWRLQDNLAKIDEMVTPPKPPWTLQKEGGIKAKPPEGLAAVRGLFLVHCPFGFWLSTVS